MILRRIELRSFRQFVDIAVDFDTGITAIVGVNGSGKTTLLEGVKYALYGDPRGKKESIASMYHGGKTLAAVEFDLGNDRFRCERTLTDASFYAQVDGEWERRAHSLTGVTAYVEKLIALTCEQFSNSYFTEQKQIEFLKFKQANKQHEQIAQMLGIQLVEVASKSAKETAKTKGQSVILLESAIVDERVLLEDLVRKQSEQKVRLEEHKRAELELSQTRKEVDALRPQIDAAKEAVEIRQRVRNRKDVGTRLKQDLEAAEADLVKRIKFVEERKSLDVVAKEFGVASAKHDEMSKLLGKFDESQKSAYRMQQMLAECEQIKTQIDPKSQEVVDAAAVALEKAREAKVAADKCCAEVESAWQSNRSAAASSVAAHKRQQAELTREIEEAEAALARGVCPTCGQDIHDGHSPRTDLLRSKLEREGNDLAKAVAEQQSLDAEPADLIKAKAAALEAATAISNAEKAVLAAQHEAKSQRELALRLEAIDVEIKALENKIAESPTTFDRAAYDAVAHRISTLRAGYDRWRALASAEDEASNALKARDEKKSQFEAEKAMHDADKARLEQIGMSEEQASEILTTFTRLENSLPLLVSAITSAEEAVRTADRAVSECQERILERKKKAEEIDALKSEQELYKEVSDAMQELRSKLNALIRPTLETFAGETLAQITDNRYNRVYVDEAFRAFIVEGEHRKSVISGGEEDVLALSLRIALSRYVQESRGLPLSMLVLDEVFGSLDPDHRQNVLAMFAGLRDMFPQIILISHVETLPDNADRVLRVRYDSREKKSVVEESLPEPSLL